MAIQLIGGTSGALAETDTTFKAVRTSLRPMEVLGWNSVGAVSGALTGVAANGPVFSFRNLSANPIIVWRLAVTFGTTTAFTTAQALGYACVFARSFTASDTGGTAIAITGSQNKHRTSLATPTSVDCRISSTAALTAGTRTLDTVALGVAYGSSTGVGTSLPLTQIISNDAGDYPVVLAQNEGLVVTNLIAMGAAGVINLSVNIEFAEATSF